MQIVCWENEGDSFVIKDPESFESEVLMRHFGRQKYASFVRQLNMYNFKKTKRDAQSLEYQNEMFKKGRRDLLSKIQRKKICSKKGKLSRSGGEESQISPSSGYSQREFLSLERTTKVRYECSMAMLELREENKKTFESIQRLRAELNEIRGKFRDISREQRFLQQRISQQHVSDDLLSMHIHTFQEKPIRQEPIRYNSEFPPINDEICQLQRFYPSTESSQFDEALGLPQMNRLIRYQESLNFPYSFNSH